jgi:hypothetical protein
MIKKSPPSSHLKAHTAGSATSQISIGIHRYQLCRGSTDHLQACWALKDMLFVFYITTGLYSDFFSQAS